MSLFFTKQIGESVFIEGEKKRLVKSLFVFDLLLSILALLFE